MPIRLVGHLVCALLLSLSFADSSLAQDSPVQFAQQDPDFAIQGEYLGPRRGLQVVAIGDGDFDALLFEGGLPGDKWNGVAPRSLELGADEVADIVSANEMRKVLRKSPSLDMDPPSGAIVLFDGSKASLENWKGGKLTSEGNLAQGTTSTATFQDFEAHIEFRTPYMPKAKGQGRGNSGIYYQGRYETQVLDSFGLEGKMNETGGIYSIRDPDLNMCYPPLSWQTYDVDFRAAKFDADGKKTQPALLTVRLNGIIVQQDVELTHSTTASPLKEGPEPGPIYLQDHGNPVEFRNIWVLPKDAEAEAKRPIVPGYERFLASAITQQDRIQAGAILLNELGCTNCHTGNAAAIEQFVGVPAKKAPTLDDIGQRVHPEFLFEYLQDTHAVKSGSTMPQLFVGLDAKQKEEAARALTCFLMTTGQLVERQGLPKSVSLGEQLFHSVGCTACHAPMNGDSFTGATSIALDAVPQKYSLDSLAAFLENPHAVRSGGRMPQLVSGEDAENVATYLLRDVAVGVSTNVQAQFYKGNWEQLPNFDQLEPVLAMEAYGFDIKLYGKRLEQFGARFDSHVMIPKSGNYRFFLGSDDGSRMFLDGKEIIDVDGIHPTQFKNATVELEAGPHTVRVEYFEGGGQEELRAEIEGPGLKRRPLETLLTLYPDGKDDEEQKQEDASKFAFDASLVAQGKQLFQSTGCANCHQLKQDDALTASNLSAPELDRLTGDGLNRGCMATEVTGTAPHFYLNSGQRESLRAALVTLNANRLQNSPPDQIHLSMISMNCYACHVRDGMGGPESSRNAMFKTTTKEMGEEGRLPPPLDGAGDKLRPDYIRQILANGANERDYMLVSMPGFGKQTLDGLAKSISEQDIKRGADIVQPHGETAERTKANGRLLAGNKGLSCIKCHTANGKGTGIRAIDMSRMTTRLNEDWFHRYLMSPTTYRPGTRMPASFPDGKSVLPDLYDGDPRVQLSALWSYLSDGTNAATPIGAEAKLIELVAEKRPVIYRNFISGLTPRGIGVGFPEGGNFAWDANRMSLALLWKGAFMDASRHWTGRGQGNQPPLGDQVKKFETGSPLAVLDSPNSAWPEDAERERGYRFLGYRLDGLGRPTLRYRIGKLEVEDQPYPVAGENGKNGDTEIRREIVIRNPSNSIDANQVVMFRVPSNATPTRTEDGWLKFTEGYSVRFEGGAVQIVENEARVIVDMEGGSGSLVQIIRW